jgi:hypothetical protein
MLEDPIATLERELLDVARQQNAASAVPQAPASSSRRRAPFGRMHRSFGAFAAVVAAGVVVVLALGAMLSLHGRSRSTPTAARRATSSPTVPGRQQLIDTLAVLRRPQTRADLNGRGAGPGLITALGVEPDTPLVRLATVTPWGARVYLTPMRPGKAQRKPHGVRFPSRLTINQEGLSLIVGNAGSCCSTATDIESRGEMMWGGAGRSFAGGSTESRFTLVVPDGVAKVEFYFPAQAIPAGGPVYRHSLAVTVPVRNNVAAVQVDRQCCAAQPAMIWYDANGAAIKQVGSTRSPPAVPPPAPETAQFRAP